MRYEKYIVREMGDTLRDTLETDCGRDGRYIMGEKGLTSWGRGEVDECFNHVTL